MNRRVFYFIYLFIYDFLYLLSRDCVNTKQLSQWILLWLKDISQLCHQSNCLCYGAAHVSFFSTFIVQKELWGPFLLGRCIGYGWRSWVELPGRSGTWAEGAGGPRFRREEEQIMAWFKRWASIYVYAVGKMA